MEGGKWTVEVESGGKTTIDTYDAVFVCTGHHSTPNVPDWEDADGFEGELMHSHYYRDTNKFQGKDVAVVGVGNSGRLLTIYWRCGWLNRGMGWRKVPILAQN